MSSENRVVVVAGRSGVSVTSGAEVDLLSTSTDGVSLNGAVRWCLTIETTQNVTVRVYKSAGSNAGLVLLSSLTATATSASPMTIEYDAETCLVMRVTAQASSTTASVNADLIGRT